MNNVLFLPGVVSITVLGALFLCFFVSHRRGSKLTTSGVCVRVLQHCADWFAALAQGLDRGVTEYRDARREALRDRQLPLCDRWGQNESLPRAEDVVR
jgi:hypothetical protein